VSWPAVSAAMISAALANRAVAGRGLCPCSARIGPDLADDCADGASADLEQFGEDVLGAQFALVEHGRQDSLLVGDLLPEHAATAAGKAFPAAAAMLVPFVAGVLDTPDPFGHRNQLGARDAGQRGIGEQFGKAGARRFEPAA
jgi:hypothetical protein